MEASKSQKILHMFTLLSMASLFFCGCSVSPTHNTTPTVLRDLAYTGKEEESQYTLLIKENESFAPYWVLADQYNGSSDCLLVRKYVLDEAHAFNKNTNFSSYYANSEIDQYLNGEFRMMLPESLQEIISPSEIAITCKYSLGCCGKETETITRDIFLLSVVEAGGLSSTTVLREGTELAFFQDTANRIALMADGTASSWWLRTPNTWYDNVTCGVDKNGAIGIGGTGGIEGESYKSGVRPAFCLNRETEIVSKGGAYYLDGRA